MKKPSQIYMLFQIIENVAGMKNAKIEARHWEDIEDLVYAIRN